MIRCTEQLIGEEQQYKPGLLSLGTGTTGRGYDRAPQYREWNSDVKGSGCSWSLPIQNFGNYMFQTKKKSYSFTVWIFKLCGFFKWKKLVR